MGDRRFSCRASEPEQVELGETVMRIMIDTNADVSVEDLGTVPAFVRESIARLGAARLQGIALGDRQIRRCIRRCRWP